MTSVRFRNQPAFVYHLGAALEVPGLGTLPVDVAWGANIVWADSVQTVATNVVWSDVSMWADNIVWGDSLIGIASGDGIIWGSAFDLDNIVWGNLLNEDNIVWGNLVDDNIVWGNLADGLDNIVWGNGLIPGGIL